MMMLKLRFEIFCTVFDLYHIIIKSVITLSIPYKIIKRNVFIFCRIYFSTVQKLHFDEGFVFVENSFEVCFGSMNAALADTFRDESRYPKNGHKNLYKA